MKILFIVPVKIFRDEPLGVMYLSSALKAAGHLTEISILGRDKAIDVAEAFNPDIIAFSIITGAQQMAALINHEIKEKFPNVFTVVGGPHCTFFPEYIETEGIDALCVGEGRQPILDLVSALEQKGDLTNISNIQVKKDGKIYNNPIKYLNEKLDDTAFPDRELLRKYHVYNKSTIFYIMTGRGCPYNCTYCFNHSYKELYKANSSLIRRRSVDNVIAEIKELKEKYSAKFIRFTDDTFILDKDWLAEFADKYSELINIPFQCNVRLNLITQEIAQTLKRAGCLTAFAAVEAGNDKIRNELLDRNMSREQVLEGTREIKKAGIYLLLLNIVGLPGTSIEDDIETMDLNIRCKPDYGACSIYHPYPRTKLGEYSLSKGFFDGDFNKILSTYSLSSPLILKDKAQVEYLHKVFGLVVSFPWLKPIALKMIKCHENALLLKIYNWLFLGFKYYRYKLRILPGF